MSYTPVLDYLPLWAVFMATLAVVMLSEEGGIRLGRYRRTLSDQEKEAPVGAIATAMLGLLGFMLAFTFGLAASRFDARRLALLEEANAIGTTYLRAGLLAEPFRTSIRKLLREYVDVRLEAVQAGQVERGVSRSAELQRPLWEQGVAAAEKDPRSITAGLFIQSLNSVIDLHATRVMFGLRSRIPVTVWVTLYALVILALAAMGYHAGLSGSRRSLAVFALALAFSAVMWMIADLDRPHEGLLRVSQQAMVDLKNSFRNPAARVDGSEP
jgi:hypothetical protein